MADLKTKRNPVLPSIPNQDEWQSYPRIVQWRKGLLAIAKQTCEDAYDDISATANATSISVLPFEYSSNVGTWTYLPDANQYGGGLLYNSSNANNNSLTYTLNLPPGDMVLKVLYASGANAPIVEVQFDGVAKANKDAYAAVGVYNSLWSVGNLSVNSAGSVAVKFVVKGKNANSGGYYFSFSNIILRKQ